MILYNMRNRGPYEYDKFTLNILQIHNAITLGEMYEFDKNNLNKDALLGIQKDINDIYSSIIGTDEFMGMAEKLYLDSYKIKEVQQ